MKVYKKTLSKTLPKLYQKCTKIIPKVYQKFTKTLPKLYQKFTERIPKVYCEPCNGSIIYEILFAATKCDRTDSLYKKNL